MDGETYVACVGAERLQDWNRVLHEDYPGTASYRALYYAALLLAEQEVIDRVVTGLPVSQYLDRQRREALTKALGGEHRVTARRTVRVRDTQVIPQPVGGYMNLVWSHDDLGLLDEARVLVIDPGFFSVDWVLVVGGEVRTRSSGTSHQATSVLLEEAGRLIGVEHGGRPGRERLENALRRGQEQVLLFGQPVAIRPYLEKAASRTVPIALTALRESLRTEADGVDLILLVGGGAGLFEAFVRSLFPRSQVIVPNEPVLANARGFWYFGAPGEE